MRKIFKSMVLSSGTIPREVRNDCYGYGPTFLKVWNKFDQEEIKLLAVDDGGAFLSKLQEIVKLACDDYCILEEMRGALKGAEKLRRRKSTRGNIQVASFQRYCGE